MPCPLPTEQRGQPHPGPCVRHHLSAPGSALWGTPACSPHPARAGYHLASCLSQCRYPPPHMGSPHLWTGGRGQGAWGLEQQQQQAARAEAGAAERPHGSGTRAVARWCGGQWGPGLINLAACWPSLPVRRAPLTWGQPPGGQGQAEWGVCAREGGKESPAWAPAAPPTTRAPLPAEATAGIQEISGGWREAPLGPRACTGPKLRQTEPR